MQTPALTVQNGTKRSTVVVVSAFWILNCAFLLSVSGCASRAKADTLAEGPPLAVPAPPVHEIVVEQVADAPPPEPPPAPDPAPPTPRPTAARPPARTEPREAPAPVPTQPAPTPPPAATEAPAVRAAPTAAAAGDEKKVRDFMAKAADDLKRVDYQRLSKEGKAQYDQSKRFSDEAQQAMKERNFLLAVTLAEKAATLAAELVR